MFFEKCGSMDLYEEDTEKILTTDHEQLQFDKNYGWSLFGFHNKPDGTLINHEYMMIYFIGFNQIVRMKILC